MKNLALVLSFIVVFGALTFSCSSDKESGEKEKTEKGKKSDSELLGAGATFPYPLYSKMFDMYHKLKDVEVNYQAIGSGGGIRQMMNQTVDFGGTDAFMDEEELADVKNSLVHIPICLGAVAVSYNLGVDKTLKLTGQVLADIFLGNITKWNHKEIKKLNPSVELPDKEIIVVHRSDGSGTTFIFSDYLSKISDAWKEKVGKGKSLNWPVGLGGKGNQGVAGYIKQMEGSIGYVEVIYATKNDMPVAQMRNKSGNYINPGIESVSKAADVELPAHTRVSLTNTDAEEGYPISGFTWILLYKDLDYKDITKKKAEKIVDLIWWMTHEGQKYVKPLHYGPLSEKAQKAAENLLKQITYKGEKLL